ncbi:2-phospho-L-lactate guanylyltransferase [Nocardia zapadnayensis]|uniref:2-phospho-L-lactate guanylyltransferase n=1 Tax=Nocardia rhamnosiphila TaxID=426716 RepID=UPI0022467486|nr:2-phospho-L-lactate guanylyltransferase [Nocardia zapadnayensis]MCX0271954.1 2-phospho-L-lactate guanylyltransferase [Nocardia zapadnayensis]
MCPHTVHAVIAVKTLDSAKSRLAGVLPPAQRSRLVLAMLTDTVRAAAAAPEIASITVVTPDPVVSRATRALGATVHPEPRSAATDPDPLNTALSTAAAALRARHGDVTVLALQADLPALRTPELSAVLATARGIRAFVADHAGTGTAALLAPAGTALRPRFGRDSARHHRDDGAVRLHGDWPGLRHDVDTADDLAAVRALGTGPDTAALLAELGWPTPFREAVTQVCQA